MGAFAAIAKNAMLTSVAALVTHKGLATKGANVTFTAATSDVCTLGAGHGYANGDTVVLSGLTPASGSGLVADRIYKIANLSSNTCNLIVQTGGSNADVLLTVTAGTINKVTELSGGAYARKAVAWQSPANGAIPDATTDITFDVPAGATVNYATGHDAVSAGNIYTLDDVTQEVFAGAGQYTLTTAAMDLNAAA